MKKIIILCTIANLTLAIAGPTINTSGEKTSDGVKYACTGDSVTLTVAGEDHSPTSQCCKDGSAPQYKDTDYTWSGDASGSSQTASLNTSSVGSKTASCSLTHNFTCGTDSAQPKNESASMSGSIEVKKDDPSAPTPNIPSPSITPLPNEQIDTTYVFPSPTGALVTFINRKGTISNIKQNNSYTAGSTTTSMGCGLSAASRKFTVASEASISLSYSNSFTSVSLSTKISASTEKDSPQQEKKPFVEHYIYSFLKRISGINGSFNGADKLTMRSSTTGSIIFEETKTASESVSIVPSSTIIDMEFNPKTRVCCPTL